MTCCQLNCSAGQPVTSSGLAICSAECATVGTPDTINGIVSSGFGALTAILNRRQQTQVAKTAVKAQAQVATAQSSMWTWALIALVAVIAFVGFARMK